MLLDSNTTAGWAQAAHGHKIKGSSAPIVKKETKPLNIKPEVKKANELFNTLNTKYEESPTKELYDALSMMYSVVQSLERIGGEND